MATSSSYTSHREFTAQLAGRPVRFVSKPGIPHWDEITPAAHLLAERLSAERLSAESLSAESLSAESGGGQWLLLGCGHGALAAFLAGSGHRLWALDTSVVALDLTRRTLAANQLDSSGVIEGISSPPALAGQVNGVIMLLPKGRKLARRWLLEAHQALRPGGAFYLAGANAEGIQSVCGDAEALFGAGNILGYRKGQRAMRWVKSPEYTGRPEWASEPGIAPGTWHEFQAAGLHIRSLPGVFSYDRLDEGTALLLQALHLPPGKHGLDFGCGYGILGLCAAIQGAARVDLVDASLPAVAAAQENIRINKITNAQALASDVLGAVNDHHYGWVISNPPFHTGKDVDYEITQTFINQAWQALEPGGQLVLVANRFIRYNLALQARFGNCQTLAETGKYHVLQAIRYLNADTFTGRTQCPPSSTPSILNSKAWAPKSPPT